MQTYKHNKLLINSYLAYFFVGLFIALLYSKADIHIIINKNHNSFFDLFFQYFTYFGDAAFAGILIILFIFIKYRYSILLLLSNIILTIVVQSSKFIFKAPRPKYYFENFYNQDYTLHLIPDINVWNWNSFPSGHSATAFCVFFILAFLSSKNQFIKILFLIPAILVAYSRMYLSQHFFVDTLFGSLIGVCIAFFSYKIIMKWKKQWLDLSIIKRMP